MAERSEERHGNPSSENNGKTAIATVLKNNKIKLKEAKQNHDLVARWQKATVMRMADRRPSKNVNNVPNGNLINILTEKYLKKGSSRAGHFDQ